MNEKKTPCKVVIIGGGFVGAAAAFSLALVGIVAEVVVVDANQAKAKGEAMDISHGLSMMKQMSVRDGGYDDVKDADIIVVTAGCARKPGETRLDLAKKNVSIARDITQKMMQYYNGGIVVVVSNPVDILTYIIQKESGIPTSKIFGSGTSLDTSRFKHLISENYDVDVSNVNGFVIGEHGDSMVPVWSHVSIDSIPLCHYSKLIKKELDKTAIEEEVKNCGAKVIQLKGATYYAIAMSITRIVEAIVKDQNSILCVGSLLNGQYGIKDIPLSLPCIINASGNANVLEIELSDHENQKLVASAGKIKEVLALVA